MGGSKNKSPAQKERSQGAKRSDTKRQKQDKGAQGPQRAAITVSLTAGQAAKAMRISKAVTVHDLARQTGVKMSAANAFLRRSVADGTVVRVGGRSGHYVYKPAA